MLTNTHVYSFIAVRSPVLHLRRLCGSELFDTDAESLDGIWTHAEPVPKDL